MEDKTKITYPESEKVYMQGQLHPYLKVGMRKVNLTPTVVVENGKKVYNCFHFTYRILSFQNTAAQCYSVQS